MKKNVISIKAILMYKDMGISKFEIDEFGELTSYEVLNYEIFFPIEFTDRRISSKGMQEFLSDRIVPETRQNLKALLEANGIYSYDTQKILQATHGLCVDDCYWLSIEGVNDSVSWEDIKIRD